MQNFKSYNVDGKQYFVLQIERDEETQEALLYRNLEERMERLQRNIEKCGSLEELQNIGGAGVQKFLVHTKNMLREFLLTYQLENILPTKEDIEEAARKVNECDITALLQYSWEKILSFANDMRNSLIENLFARQTCAA